MSSPPKASLKDDQEAEKPPVESKIEEEKSGENETTKKGIACVQVQERPDVEDFRICTYRDFSHVKPPENMSSIIKNPSIKEATFPVKLHAIVSNRDFPEIQWLPHGRSWRIISAKAFEERVIPLFFRHGRYSSFSRQVNGWGFRRMTQGADYNSYYHELFLRGMPHLALKMRRLTKKDTGVRKQAEREKTPDLTAISKEHPLPEDIPMLPTAALPTGAAPETHGMDSYLTRLSENGGIDAYLSSLTDAEISFLARRQLFRPSNALLGGNMAQLPAMNPGVFRQPLGANNPGGNMNADLRASASGSSDTSGGLSPNVASMPGNAAAQPTTVNGTSSVRKDGANSIRNTVLVNRNPPPPFRPPQAEAAMFQRGHPPPQGTPTMEQLLNQPFDNEMAQLLAIQNAEAARRRQHMPPFGGGGGGV